MRRLSMSYEENVAQFDSLLHVSDNFDVIKKTLKIKNDEMTLYYIDGFVKDTVMQKMMIYFLSLDGLGDAAERGAEGFMIRHVPYVEADVSESLDTMLQMVLSGATLLLGSTFDDKGIIIDARSYPARETSEPQSDRVMRGSRDGFVETLIFNTALIRRRIRDTSLTMNYMTVGKNSKSDVVLCYMSDRADMEYVESLRKKLMAINTDSLTMGHESLSECLFRRQWYNPFPKIRSTERPDAAAAQLLEGNVLILVDNSPEAMILPTTIFDFLQETNDFYFPPLTGSYIRILRHIVFWLTLFLVPLWYLLVKNPEIVPEAFQFILPKDSGELPIIVQLLIVELIIDGLRMASMNTPDMLTNSLSVVGGLILGEFAVEIGWLIPEVILYMAFVAIANFTQRNYELGYAFKFLRMLLLVLTALFNYIGFGIGVILVFVLIGTNKTVNGKRSYLYPLIPFNPRALWSLLIRVKKRDLHENNADTRQF